MQVEDEAPADGAESTTEPDAVPEAAGGVAKAAAAAAGAIKGAGRHNIAVMSSSPCAKAVAPQAFPAPPTAVE